MKEASKTIIDKFLEFLFGKPTIVSDPFFGEMVDAGDYYECERLFTPIGDTVEIFLTKKENGPDEKQINFFLRLEENYDLFIQRISPSMEEAIQEWIPKFRIQNFKQEFSFKSLSIPKCDESVSKWELSFYARNDLRHYCELTMEGMEVKAIHIDG
ncbi:MAG: hypothetical protein AAF828_12850 [Bacteroidota bacterium]